MPGFGRAERRNMPKKQFSEEFKKKTIKNMIRFGLTKKEAAHKVKVTETALGYWKDKKRSYLASGRWYCRILWLEIKIN